MTHPTGIVVFTGDLSYSVRRGIVEVDRHVPGLHWLVVLQSRPKTLGGIARSQWLNLKRNGWRWIPYQAGDLLSRFLPSRDVPAPADAPGSAFTSAGLESRPNVRILRVADLHAEATLTAVRAFAPELGLSLAAPILRRALFAIPRRGTVNLHKGKVPDYRGMPPAFWELVHDERSVGCTVHWVDDKLDTGAIAGKTVVPREQYSTLRGLQLRLDQVGVELMRDVVAAILRGEPCADPQPPGGKTFRKPTLAEVAALASKMRVVQPAAGNRLRQFVKNAVARAVFTAWRRGLHRLATPRLTVLLYHRVSDEARDNLTVGVEQFDRQMALLRRYCRVVSIEDVVGWAEVPRSAEPLVCITFDDGYLDNYDHAAPILERHQLPAAFFVSTGIVASDNRFPHDVRRNNPPLPVMQWDQMRSMRERGFTLGSHSVQHIDCAGEPEERVRAELAQSRDDLVRELGLPPAAAIFAYPYGGRQHMTPARLELVRQAGYRACLSAYGGANVGRIDRWNVVRRGIQWEFSDAAFLLECIGVR